MKINMLNKLHITIIFVILGASLVNSLLTTIWRREILVQIRRWVGLVTLEVKDVVPNKT